MHNTLMYKRTYLFSIFDVFFNTKYQTKYNTIIYNDNSKKYLDIDYYIINHNIYIYVSE